MSGGGRRRTEAEARRCSQDGCPGDGRYQPPGRGHLLGCQHNAVMWVWETVCRHCGKPPEVDGDHSCTCPHPDDFCPDHPRPGDPWNSEATP